MYTCAVPSTLSLVLVRHESEATKKNGAASNNKVGAHKHLSFKHYGCSEPNYFSSPIESKCVLYYSFSVSDPLLHPSLSFICIFFLLSPHLRVIKLFFFVFQMGES